MIVRVFRDDTLRVALKPTTSFRFEVRSVDYEQDPMPIIELVLDALADYMRTGDFEETCSRSALLWTHAAFDRANIARWAGWTNAARRRTSETLARLERRARIK